MRSESKLTCIALALATIAGCQEQPAPETQIATTNPVVNLSDEISHNAANMQVTYQVVSNIDNTNCDNSRADGNCYQSQLELTFSSDLPASGWSMYFGHLSPIQKEDSEAFDIRHINGDLHQLNPVTSIEADKKYVIPLQSDFWSVSVTDVLPNYFLVDDEEKASVIVATQAVDDPITGINIARHAGAFDGPQHYQRNDQDNSILATAEQVFTDNQRLVVSMPEAPIRLPGLSLARGLSLQSGEHSLSNIAKAALADAGLSLSDDGVRFQINIEASDYDSEEAFTLSVTDEKITLQAGGPAGLTYGVFTLLEKLSASQEIAQGNHQLSPAFAFRGVHLDVARNFRSATFVKQLLDEMVRLKLNKFHFHLADDEGWRLEIPALPELTEVSAYRCFDLKEKECLLPQLGSGPEREAAINGFYSVGEYMELVRYAEDRHIQVIPSLDMPGHARAAIKAMEARTQKLSLQEDPNASQYRLIDPLDTTIYQSIQFYNDNTINPCLESSYQFVETVLDGLIALHRQAGQPLKRYHIGADETAGAWKQSPACKNYIADNSVLTDVSQLTAHFVSRVSDILLEKGVLPAGWSDGLSKVDPQTYPAMQVNVWDPLMWQGHKHADHFAKVGWDTVMSFPDLLYFDFPYAVYPQEPGYYWAS